MFSTIVIGTDGSSNAEDALRVAADLAATLPDTCVHVVTAYQPLSSWDVTAITAELPEEFRDLIHSRSGGESILASAQSILKSRGVQAKLHDIDAKPVDALLTAVEDLGADLLVVGSRGEGRAQRALHGSVSTNVLHHASCSVLVVKRQG